MEKIPKNSFKASNWKLNRGKVGKLVRKLSPEPFKTTKCNLYYLEPVYEIKDKLFCKIC